MTELEQEIANRKKFISEIIKQNDLDKIDLSAESEKIKRKESNLSDAQRKLVLEVVEFRNLTEEMEKIAEATNA